MEDKFNEHKLNSKEYRVSANAFTLKDVFECGQCFRWNPIDEQKHKYVGVVDDMVIEVEERQTEKSDDIEIKVYTRSPEQNLEQNLEFDNKEMQDKIYKYFDLDRNYDELKEKLLKIDDNVFKAIQYGGGIRILNQDLWETIISFIISANNNIPRIKGIIERLSKKYGKHIVEDYYSFPKPEELAKATIEDLRKLGLGFRDKRVYETAQIIVNSEIDVNQWYEQPTEQVREQLLELPGIGPKVADCILLFSDLKRFDVFPVDVWVRRVMNELYIKNADEKAVNKKQIEQIAKEKFGAERGLVQQYLFYWKRDN